MNEQISVNQNILHTNGPKMLVIIDKEIAIQREDNHIRKHWANAVIQIFFHSKSAENQNNKKLIFLHQACHEYHKIQTTTKAKPVHSPNNQNP